MDHRLMSFAKAIIAEAINAGNSSRLDVINLLQSRLPKSYAGRSVEARQWLLQEGFIEPTESSDFDSVTKEAVKYIKSAGDDYLKTAKMMLDQGIDNLDDLIVREQLMRNYGTILKKIESQLKAIFLAKEAMGRNDLLKSK